MEITDEVLTDKLIAITTMQRAFLTGENFAELLSSVVFHFMNSILQIKRKL